MSLLIYILLGIVLLMMASAMLIVLNVTRTKGSLARSLDLQLMLFAMPRMGPGQQQQDDKKLISLMEQLFATISTFKIKGWNKFLYGDPYIALEIAVHHSGEQIFFYAAVPSKYADQFEKQVSGVFPSAQVTKSPDYNIFNPQGASAGAFLKFSEHPMLPIQTYTELPTDPLGPIVSAMARLESEGEGASLQVVLRPSADNSIRKLAVDTARLMQSGITFSKALKLAQNPPKKDEKKDGAIIEPPKVATEFESRVIKSLQSKASRPLFDCNVRLVASAQTQERASMILSDIVASFSQFAAPDLNSFKLNTVKSGRELEKFLFNYSFRLFDNNQLITLSSEEVTSLYHFPVSSALLPKVKFANFRTAPPPPDMPAEGVVFGMNVFQGVETPLKLNKEARRRHMYVLGQTGTGKSVTLGQMINQDLRNGEGITIIEPHSDLGVKALRHVPKERMDDVVYFDPTDVANPMGLNLLEFDINHPEQKTLIIDELFQIMSKLYDLSVSGGPQFERYFKNSIFLLLDNYERRIPTLADVSRVFVDEAFRNDLLAHEPNPIVKQFWELEATKTTGDQSLTNFAGYITSKIDTFTSNDFLRPIVNQQKSAIDFNDIIENKKILICNLAKGKIGQLNSDLLGLVIINKLQRAALSRDIQRAEFPDHYVYIDEFQNYATPQIKTILSEARKYKLCLIMAHQYVTQLPEDIRDAIYGNVGTMLIARISPEDAETPKIKTRFEPTFTSYDISNIDNLNAYVSMLVGQSLARPTSCRLMLEEIKADPGDPEMENALIEISRLKFGRPKAEVEAEITARFNSNKT